MWRTIRSKAVGRWLLGGISFTVIVILGLVLQGLEAASWWAAIAGLGATLAGMAISVAQAPKAAGTSAPSASTQQAKVTGKTSVKNAHGTASGVSVDGELNGEYVEGTAEAEVIHPGGDVAGVRYRRHG